MKMNFIVEISTFERLNTWEERIGAEFQFMSKIN